MTVRARDARLRRAAEMAPGSTLHTGDFIF